MLSTFAYKYLGDRWRDRNRLVDQILARIREDAGIDLPPSLMSARQIFGAQLQQFATTYGSNKEVIREPAYSIKTYATGGYTQRIFFDQTFGTATNGWSDTNMNAISQFPAGEAFIVTNIRVFPLPAAADYETGTAGTPVAFMQWTEVLNRNVEFEFWASQKPYLRVAPLSIFPTGFGPGAVPAAGAATVLRNVSFPGTGTPDMKAVFLLDPPLFLAPLQTFIVYNNWTTALTVTTAGRLGWILDGFHIRNIQ